MPTNCTTLIIIIVLILSSAIAPAEASFAFHLSLPVRVLVLYNATACQELSPLHIFSSMTVSEFHPECLFFRATCSFNCLSLGSSFTTESRVWVPSPQKGKPETLTHMKGAYIRKWEVSNRKPIKVYVINVVTTVEIGIWSYSEFWTACHLLETKEGNIYLLVPILNWLKPTLTLAKMRKHARWVCAGILQLAAEKSGEESRRL